MSEHPKFDETWQVSAYQKLNRMARPSRRTLRERIEALTSPARYENDRNGNWWTTDMEYGWDEAISAVLSLLAPEADQ